MNNLEQARICTQLPLPHEEHMYHPDVSAELQASFFTSKLWPKGSTIKVEFLDDKPNMKPSLWTRLEEMKARRNNDGSASKIDPIEEEIRGMSRPDAVKKVVKDRIEAISGLKFEFVGKGQGDVRVSFDGALGAWSLLGIDCLSADKGKATLNLGWMDAATIMHEFGHVIGLIHEHNNPRGAGIDWNKPVVYKWAMETQGWDKQKVDQNMFMKYSKDQTNGSEYDPKSIMLYFFPASMTLNGVGTDINQRMSKTDVDYIESVYPGGRVKPDDYDTYTGNEPDSGSNSKSSSWGLLAMFIVAMLTIGLIAYFLHRNKSRGLNTQYNIPVQNRYVY